MGDGCHGLSTWTAVCASLIKWVVKNVKAADKLKSWSCRCRQVQWQYQVAHLALLLTACNKLCHRLCHRLCNLLHIMSSNHQTCDRWRCCESTLDIEVIFHLVITLTHHTSRRNCEQNNSSALSAPDTWSSECMARATRHELSTCTLSSSSKGNLDHDQKFSCRVERHAG